MASNRQRVETIRAILAANPNGVNFWKLCVAGCMTAENGGKALDELIVAGEVEFVEPDLWRLREAVKERT